MLGGSVCKDSELGTFEQPREADAGVQGERPSHTRPCVVQVSGVYSKNHRSYGRCGQENGIVASLGPCTSLPSTYLFL